MNKFTIFGILSFGAGMLLISPLTDNLWSVLVGIAFQILGLYLINRGAIISRKQVAHGSENNLKNYFEENLKDIRQDLQAAKKVADKVEVEKIESKFENWAKEFESNKNLKVLELSREEIKKKEHEELLNKEWLKTYQTIFSILENLLRSYSKLPNSNVSKVQFPEFPSKIISKEAAHYFAKINIGSYFLYISLSVRSPELKEEIPEIVFKIDNEDKDLDKSLFAGELYWSSDSIIIFEINSEKNWVYWSKNRNKFDESAVKYELPESNEKWEVILKEIVEHIIAKAEVKYNYL